MLRRRFLLFFLIFSTLSIKKTLAIIEYGIKAGVNQTTIQAKDQLKPVSNFGMKLNDVYAPKSSPGYGFNLGFWINSGDVLYFQPEIELTTKSSSFLFELKTKTNAFSDEYISTFENGKVTFVNVELPLLFGLRFGFYKLDFDLYSGPLMQFNLYTIKEFPENIIGEDSQYHQFDNYNALFIGIEGGVKVSLGDYSLHFKKIYSASDIDTNFDQSFNSISFGITYRIHNGRIYE